MKDGGLQIDFRLSTRLRLSCNVITDGGKGEEKRIIPGNLGNLASFSCFGTSLVQTLQRTRPIVRHMTVRRHVYSSLHCSCRRSLICRENHALIWHRSAAIWFWYVVFYIRCSTLSSASMRIRQKPHTGTITTIDSTGLVGLHQGVHHREHNSGYCGNRTT